MAHHIWHTYGSYGIYHLQFLFPLFFDEASNFDWDNRPRMIGKQLGLNRSRIETTDVKHEDLVAVLSHGRAIYDLVGYVFQGWQLWLKWSSHKEVGKICSPVGQLNFLDSSGSCQVLLRFHLLDPISANNMFAPFPYEKMTGSKSPVRGSYPRE